MGKSDSPHLPAEFFEAPFHRIEFRTLGREAEGHDIAGPAHLLADMTGTVGQDHPHPGAAIVSTQAADKEGKAVALQRRQEQKDTPPGARLSRGRQPQPLAPVLDHPRGTNAPRTPPPPMPTLEAQARFIPGKDPLHAVRCERGPEVLF
ncbi:MAG TPA: hypothetical protein VNN62_09640 [Methylomirabilota bacterium]|nr:hypothetical protein [Methylomirabilota bacterium]